jgi:hypothetical protein
MWCGEDGSGGLACLGVMLNDETLRLRAAKNPYN